MYTAEQIVLAGVEANLTTRQIDVIIKKLIELKKLEPEPQLQQTHVSGSLAFLDQLTMRIDAVIENETKTADEAHVLIELNQQVYNALKLISEQKAEQANDR